MVNVGNAELGALVRRQQVEAGVRASPGRGTRLEENAEVWGARTLGCSPQGELPGARFDPGACAGGRKGRLPGRRVGHSQRWKSRSCQQNVKVGRRFLLAENLENSTGPRCRRAWISEMTDCLILTRGPVRCPALLAEDSPKAGWTAPSQND